MPLSPCHTPVIAVEPGTKSARNSLYLTGSWCELLAWALLSYTGRTADNSSKILFFWGGLLSMASFFFFDRFNYRSTHHLTTNGFYEFLNWFDERAWYPLGRIVGGTVSSAQSTFVPWRLMESSGSDLRRDCWKMSKTRWFFCWLQDEEEWLHAVNRKTPVSYGNAASRPSKSWLVKH